MTPETCEAGAFTVERHGDHAFAKPSRRLDQCATCGGTGLLRSTIEELGKRYDVSKPCALSGLQARLLTFNQAQLPAVHANSDFKTFVPTNTKQDEALRRAKEFAGTWPSTRGFILSGPVGTGKTHILVSALRHLTTELGVRASYVEISLLYATIRRGFQEGKSGGEIIKPLSEVDLLAIDELGKGRGSPFELETLDELIARRYNAGKITLFATNYGLAAPEERGRAAGYESTEDRKEAARESKMLCDRVGARIYSRLCEMCDFVEFPATTSDHRRHSADHVVLRAAKTTPRGSAR